ncbi:S26 family signal peptidase [Novosphingobium sp. RL4]|uniref:S26 family signal peptidase n=1 Tax=Novosphingobium sp. RL4 TaxID=3109595 RepID=UPI002D791D25|nr:S26 family signal peptidase [Novosphingobium sp. RL4]WRT94484.1 S26 family signal peptidase [Novosphingobium sp. RL4]
MSALRTSRGDAPLHAWGAALRKARLHCRRIRRAAISIGILVSAVGWTVGFQPAPRLVWNASASAPIGLYSVSPGTVVATGDMVIATLPEPSRAFAATRRYLPSNVPLVKRVAAGPGDEVCAIGARIFVEGMPVASRRQRDGHGRLMPWWEGCRRLRGGQFFLLMKGSPDSFDGRYFGVTAGSEIVGPARLLWAR